MPGRAFAADRWVEIANGVILASLTIFIVSRRDYGGRFWLGMAIAAVGISLWALARIQLGSSFSVSPRARRLVTTGLYSKFRNPIYLFGGVGIVGLLVALGNWTVLVMFLALYPIQISRAKKEAKALEATFGDEYRRYRARTWF